MISRPASSYDSEPRLYQRPTLDRTAEPAIEPVTPEEVVDFLKRHPDDLSLYADAINLCIQAAREKLEDLTERALVATTYRQVMDNAGARIELLRRNVLSISSVETYTDMESTSTVVLSSARYFLERGRTLVSRDGSWPVHRGSGSLLVTFVAGFRAYPVTYPGVALTDGDKVLLRAAVPANYRLACLNLIGHWLENPEGQGPELRYQAQTTASASLPANVLALIKRPWSVA